MATALGELTLVGEDEVLTGVYFPAHRPAPRAAYGVPRPGALQRAADQLREYLAAERSGLELEFALPAGPPIHRAVWELIAAIPRGETRTYGELGDALRGVAGAGLHPRAVGGAVAHNPLSIVVPCHRVVGVGGSLTGYAGGIERKRALLEIERTPVAAPATSV